MPRLVAFLRGINLGNRRLPMSRLRALFEELGFDAVETFIASGNVLFSTRAKAGPALESRIARHLAAKLGYAVDTFVRPLAGVATIARAKLFPEDGDPAATIHVAFLHGPLAPDVAAGLAAVRTAHDAFRVGPCEFYWLCRIRSSESKVWTLPEVRALRLPASTLRNLTSLRKLVAQHAP